jgi:RPA family protein
LRRVAYEASGLHQLLSAVAGRIADGPGARMVEELRAEARNIVSMMETVQTIGAKSGADHDVAAIKQRLDRIRDTALSRHQQNLEQTREDLEARLRRAQEAFVESALSALSSHVAIYGEAETWTHEPMSLRMSMRSAYLSACKSLDRKAQALLVEGAAAVQDILDVDLAVVGVDLPDDQVFFPIIRPPSSLSATLSLDLSQAWWQRFWKFGAAARLRKKYADVILAETDPLIEQVLTQHFDQRAAEVLEVIQDYLNDRARYITAILDQKTPATKQTRDVA